MSNSLSANRLVRNEQIIRNRNTEIEKSLKKRFFGTKKAKLAPIDFVCECSDLECTETVSLTIQAYEKIHQRKDRFVLAKGHEINSIESVSVTLDRYNVVEKAELAP